MGNFIGSDTWIFIKLPENLYSSLNISFLEEGGKKEKQNHVLRPLN